MKSSTCYTVLLFTMKRLVLMTSLSTLVVLSAWSQQVDTNGVTLTAQVDAIFAQYDNRQSPGCAVAVMRTGDIIYKRGYGMADLQHDVPITPSTPFSVASISKVFTGASVALLALEGKLARDDDIRIRIPRRLEPCLLPACFLTTAFLP